MLTEAGEAFFSGECGDSILVVLASDDSGRLRCDRPLDHPGWHSTAIPTKVMNACVTLSVSETGTTHVRWMQNYDGSWTYYWNVMPDDGVPR